MFLFCAAILYLIAGILGFWSASLLWRAWHSWRLSRRGKRVYSPLRRRFGVGVALIALPFAGVALTFGEVVRSGQIEAKIEPMSIGAQALGAVMGFMALSAVYVARRFDPSHGRRRCSKCWYDMSATNGRRCPECGFEATEERGLFRTRRAPRLALASVVFMVTGYGVHVTPKVMQHGWPAIMPTTVMIVGISWLPEHYISSAEHSLSMRAYQKELWGWQRWLLKRRLDRIVENSTDLTLLGHAGQMWGVLDDGETPRRYMNAGAQIEFLKAFETDMKTTGRLRPSFSYSMVFLPETLAPEAASVAMPALKRAMATGTPWFMHWAMAIAPTVGREASAMTPQLITMAESTTNWLEARAIAYSSLARIGEWDDVAWDAYLRGFDIASDDVRLEIIRFAQRTKRKDERLKQKLVEALDDQREDTSRQAAVSLLYFDPLGCGMVADLVPAMKRRPIAQVVVELAQRCPGPEVVEVIQAIFDRSTTADDHYVYIAAARLGAHGEPLLPILKRKRELGDYNVAQSEELDKAIETIEAAVKARGQDQGATRQDP